MSLIKTPWLMFWHAFGFDGVGDFISTTFGMKSSASIIIQIATAATIGYYAKLEQYVYSPGQAVILMIVMILVDTILGAMVAMKKGEKFNLAKISRFMPIVCAHVMVMSATWHFKQIDMDAYGWMPSATFGFLGVRNLLSVIRNLIKLKYIRSDFLSFLNTKIDSDLLTNEDDTPKESNSVLPVILILISLSSCVTYDRCARKFGSGSDTVVVTVHDTVRIKIAGDSISRNFTDGTLDSMAVGDSFEFETPPEVDQTKSDPDKTSIAPVVTVRIRKTGKGTYRAEGIVKPTEVIVYKTIKAKCPPCPKLKPSDSIKWKWFIIGAVAGIIFTIVVSRYRP
jgi:hypothetical protein